MKRYDYVNFVFIVLFIFSVWNNMCVFHGGSYFLTMDCHIRKEKGEMKDIILNILHIYWLDKFAIGREPKVSATIHSITYIIISIFW